MGASVAYEGLVGRHEMTVSGNDGLSIELEVACWLHFPEPE